MPSAPLARRMFKYMIILLVLGGLLVFLSVAVNGYLTLQAIERETGLRSQARESLLWSRSVLSLLKDVETGQRGFILTGDEHYLSPYDVGMRETGPAFEALLLSLRPERYPQGMLATLETLIAQRLDIARRNVETRKQQGFAAAQIALTDNKGRRVMDEIRTHFAELDRILRIEIDQRGRVLATQMRRALWSTGLLTVVAATMIVIAFWRLFCEARRRERAEQALHDVNVHLEETIAARTADLEQARREIGAFALRLDRGVEAERRRLAREVHDQLGQVFTALRMTLDFALKDVADIGKDMARVNGLLDEGIATTRRIAAELRPPLLDDLGFGPAMAYLAQRFTEQSGTPVAVRIEAAERLLPEQGLQLYRIAQESLTNIARHAQAGRIWIEGDVQDDHYRLIVEDNGRGMKQEPPGAQGLANMRERAMLAGGRLQLEAGREGGVRVQVCLPLRDREHGDVADTHC